MAFDMEKALRNLDRWGAECERMKNECLATTARLLSDSRAAIERSRAVLGRSAEAAEGQAD
jgi:hypothetical protein